MAAKKSAAQKRPAPKKSKAVKAKAPARKAAPKAAAKAPAKPAAKSAAAKAKAPATAKSAAKPVAPAKAAAAKAAPKIGVIKAIAPAAAVTKAAAPKKAVAARAKPAASASFDPDRRRELIAAAAARHRKATPARAPLVPIAIVQPREPSPAERHRFSVGDEVRVISTSGMWFKHGVDYRITAALPPQAGKLQYRIKNEAEPFERVVSESQLANSPAAQG